MAHNKASDHKREQFRRYLEKTGVVDSLTTALVALYEQPEKPSNALEFVKQHFITGLTLVDTEALQREVNEMKQKCERLEEENKDLKEKLQQYEVTQEDPATAE